jgi:hypothetical protein
LYGVKSRNWACATVISQDRVEGRGTGGVAVTGSSQSLPNSTGGTSAEAAAGSGAAPAAGAAAAGDAAPSSEPAVSASPASMDMIFIFMRQE